MKSLILVFIFSLLLSSCSNLQNKNSKLTDYKNATKTNLTFSSTRINDFLQPLNCYLSAFQEVTGNVNHETKNEVELIGPHQQRAGLMKVKFTFEDEMKVIIEPDFNGDTEQGIGIVIQNDPIKLVLLEKNPNPHNLIAFEPLSIHTFFKDSGMYVYYKTNSLSVPNHGIEPRATMATGWCEAES